MLTAPSISRCTLFQGLSRRVDLRGKVHLASPFNVTSQQHFSAQNWDLRSTYSRFGYSRGYTSGSTRKMAAGLPVVVVGRNPKIAGKVREGLGPEYDAIHIILSLEQATTDIPLLLATPSQTPPNSQDNQGSQKYGARPVAVAVGGGFNDEMFAEIKNACKDVDKGVVWLRADVAKIKEMPPLSELEAYGEETARRVKKKLEELGVGGGDGEGKEGVYFFT
ncbi:hypothetical protein BKA63DRAFT_319150 [Paraphoma chrysanthemicola]|nr:hypothetical protein BKA63DRAFT_319150 [Paraphoma chrysanthemicola]